MADDFGSNRDGRSRRDYSSNDRRSNNQSSNRSDNYGNKRANFRTRRKVCAFCTDKVKVIDWKDVDGLRRFVDDSGSIRARRKTGTCAKHQRRLAVAVKRARYIALLPFTNEHIRLARKS